MRDCLSEHLREWRNGSARPSQGWGCGFESRLSLIKQVTTMSDLAVITISRIELKRMLDAYRESMLDEFEHMVARAITKASIDSGQSSPSMSQAAAFKMYGRRTVEHWVEIGKLHPFSRGKGNRKVFLVEQLQDCAKTSNFKRN